jgi:hypothetical protein
MRARSPWDHPILVWWAECADILDQLTPRYRARALAIVAEDLRQTLASMPDRDDMPPWLINRLLGQEVFVLPPREWHEPEPGDEVRIIG